jgi:hypothetical protein
MAYETGTSSGPSDLVSKLLTFAAANGWTVTPATVGSVLSKSDIVCGILADATTIQLCGGLSASGAVAWNAQPNNPGVSFSCNVGAGPYPAYHFYSDAESGAERLYASIEISSGIYRHLLMCRLVKIGAWTGGTYIAATYHLLSTPYIDSKEASQHAYLADTNGISNHHLSCDTDGRVNSWSTGVDSGSSVVTGFHGNYRNGGLGYNSLQVGHARFSLRTILQPLLIFQIRPSGLRSIVGYVPNLRGVNMELYPVGFLDNIGGDDWRMWPNTLRTDNNGSIGSTTPSSGWYGYASRQIA